MDVKESDELSGIGVFSDGKVFVVDIKEFLFLFRLVKTTTPDQYLGSIIKICQDKRGIQNNLTYFPSRRKVRPFLCRKPMAENHSLWVTFLVARKESASKYWGLLGRVRKRQCFGPRILA